MAGIQVPAPVPLQMFIETKALRVAATGSVTMMLVDGVPPVVKLTLRNTKTVAPMRMNSAGLTVIALTVMDPEPVMVGVQLAQFEPKVTLAAVVTFKLGQLTAPAELTLAMMLPAPLQKLVPPVPLSKLR